MSLDKPMSRESRIAGTGIQASDIVDGLAMSNEESAHGSRVIGFYPAGAPQILRLTKGLKPIKVIEVIAVSVMVRKYVTLG